MKKRNRWRQTARRFPITGGRNAFKGKISYSGNDGTELLLDMSQSKCKAVFRISPAIPAAVMDKYRKGSRDGCKSMKTILYKSFVLW